MLVREFFLHFNLNHFDMTFAICIDLQLVILIINPHSIHSIQIYIYIFHVKSDIADARQGNEQYSRGLSCRRSKKDIVSR